MNPEELELWTRIDGFQIDDPNATFPFSLKLAKEYDWDLKFTAEAINEYKKYAFLSCILEHTSPSPIVDKVWHVHLLYTKQYWQIWCKDILKRELHHNPANGGHTEQQELKDVFKMTKLKYTACFEVKPPKKYWT